MSFAEKLINWYHQNKRSLPWRNTEDPYKIWLSEIILQQTRVNQGMSYYLKFIEEYPTVKDLANASEESVMKNWQGLGYYSRARNLHFTAKHISSKLNGVFPNSFNEIIKLKGVGKYTAAAIASFCFGEAVPVVDGNVYRVLSRIFGIETPIDSTQGVKEFFELAEKLLDKKKAGDFNQAIMEFGAMQCTPKNPNCEECPFSDRCIALQKKSIGLLPVKSKKTKQLEVFFHYLVISYQNAYYLKKRTEKGIWQNLHDFPLIELDKKLPEGEIFSTKEFSEILEPKKFHLSKTSKVYKHILSHRIIKAIFYEIELEHKLEEGSFILVPKLEIEKYAVPRLIEIYLKDRKIV